MICEGPFSKRKVAEVEYMNTSSNVAMELDGKRIHYQRKVKLTLLSNFRIFSKLRQRWQVLPTYLGR